MMRKQDTWLLFFNQDTRGVLMKLLPTATQWHEENQNTLPKEPLRHRLTVTMFQEFQERLTKVSQLPDTDPLRQTLLTKKLLTEKGEWPYLRWNASTKRLEVTERPGLTMKAALAVMAEILEILTEQHVIVKFNSLTRRT